MNPLYTHLKSSTLSDLSMPVENIETIESSESIEQAVKHLKSRNILSCPVVENGAVIGVLDMQELLSFLVSCVAPSEDEEIAERNMTMRSVKDLLTMSPRDVLTPLDPRDTATMAVELFATGVHRCPLTDETNKLAGLVTQVDLAMQLVLAMREGSSQEVGARSLESLGIGLREPVWVDGDQDVGDTLTQLDAYQLSSLAVVDGQRVLKGNFSITDVISLWKGHGSVAEGLNQSVTAYLQKNSPKSLEPITCTRSTTLLDATAIMVDKQVHRLWVVDGDNKPIGVYSMTDLFKVVRDLVAAEGAADKHTAREAFGVTIRAAADNHVLSVNEAGDGVDMRKKASDEHSLWTIEHGVNSAVKLRAANGKYLAVTNKHAVTLADAADADTNLSMIHLDTGFVAFHSDHDGFLQPQGAKITSHATKSNRPAKRQLFKVTGSFAGKKK
eukprot:TRINITY_DN9894_c0_g1_i1.p2 TRINITY_DN9894_c0_g1~~TRINITY_DN9894_c0_g1_i1.p2  ORF type:complete len:465 (-),score=238.11 TRINITY_DN9894_c0_g1_i1:71-1399(-)